MIIPTEIEGYKLTESNEEGYYLYKKEYGFGFTNAKEIRKIHFDTPELKDKPFWETKELAGTCKMMKDVPDRYLICRRDYHLTLKDALDYLMSVKVKPKPPKRKLIYKEPATVEELNEYLGVVIFKENN
jgi:hypothetical protein